MSRYSTTLKPVVSILVTVQHHFAVTYLSIIYVSKVASQVD